MKKKNGKRRARNGEITELKKKKKACVCLLETNRLRETRRGRKLSAEKTAMNTLTLFSCCRAAGEGEVRRNRWRGNTEKEDARDGRK